MPGRRQLTASVVFTDGDLVRLQVSFVDGDWAARASAYTDRAAIATFARELGRFRVTLRGECSFTAGAEGDESPLGFVALRLYPVDVRGHLACHVRLKSSASGGHRPEELARVAVELRTEPALLDAFAVATEGMLEGEPAVLRLVRTGARSQ